MIRQAPEQLFHKQSPAARRLAIALLEGTHPIYQRLPQEQWPALRSTTIEAIVREVSVSALTREFLDYVDPLEALMLDLVYTPEMVSEAHAKENAWRRYKK